MPPAKARSRRGQPRLRNGKEFFDSLSSEETGWKMDVAVGEEEAGVAERDVFLDVVGLFTGVVSTLRKPSAVLEIAGLDNMRDPGILDPRHFFSPGTFTRFTRFLHDFT